MALKFQPPVIVIPGITASNLHDEYEVDPQTVWSALKHKWDNIALHPDDIRYERDEPARVRERSVFGLVYEDLIEELRHELSPRADLPTPVYPFAYDWRMPLEILEDRLGAFIDEVIDRTKLMPHYHQAGFADNPCVDLVGHSMGGLIAAGYMQSYGPSSLVRRLATLGSPFRGSHEAELKITTGLSTLNSAKARSAAREREVARLTPALYHLLPSYEGAVKSPAGMPNTLFNPKAWQPGVTATMAEYLRLHGIEKLNKAEREQRAGELLANLLKQAKSHRSRLEKFRLADAGLNEDDHLCVVGVGEETRVRLQIIEKNGEPYFDLTSVDRKNGYPNPDSGEAATDTGDGTVPYFGAMCAFTPTERTVCVCDSDFGYWEIGDRILEGPVGLHGMLPKMNLCQRLVASFLHKDGRKVGSVWGRVPPDLAQGTTWRPPIKGLKAKG